MTEGQEWVQFVIYGEPVGKGRPRFNLKTGRTYTPEKTARYENLVKMAYWAQCGDFHFPDDAMLDMLILAYYAIPKSQSRKRQALMREGGIRPTKTPDMDNIVKVVADSLNHVAYRDDRQVVDCQVRKFYAEEPKVEVTIRRAGNV